MCMSHLPCTFDSGCVTSHYANKSAINRIMKFQTRVARTTCINIIYNGETSVSVSAKNHIFTLFLGTRVSRIYAFVGRNPSNPFRDCLSGSSRKDRSRVLLFHVLLFSIFRAWQRFADRRTAMHRRGTLHATHIALKGHTAPITNRIH